HDGTFTGLDGSTWSYTQCRGDSVIVAPSPTLGKKRPITSKIVSGTLHNGCGTISFDYKQTFSSAVDLDLFINGTLFANVTSTAQGVVTNSGNINVNLPGDFTLMFKQADSSNSGQVTIDNVVWTAYSGGTLPEPTNYPTSFAASNAPYTVNLAWTDATGAQVPTAYLILASDQNNITAPADGTPVADDATLADGHGALNIFQGVQHATFGNLPSNKQYFFKIFPYTNAGSLINYKTDGTAPSASITTLNTVIIDSIHFSSLNFANWIVKNVTGDSTWVVDAIHGVNAGPCAKMSGYYNTMSNVNEDWLISPAMNFNLYNNENLTFQSAYKYTGDPLQVMVSNDYDGTSNPADFSWAPLTATWSAGNWVWTPSGNISLSSVNGTQVYVGFKYTSTATASSTWELDDIVITGELIIGMDDKTPAAEFSVSPNPATDRCVIRFNAEGPKVIRLVSLVGNTLLEQTTSQKSHTVNFGSIPAGIYFLKVFLPESNTTVVRKLIVR
ncbi:MAG TPA: choice-of-anchor J domain-containing protein, partial [Bacteroidales bacterium]|nr:choice-of-anchor J domain-containing protein [Bacteroidales bacterium]